MSPLWLCRAPRFSRRHLRVPWLTRAYATPKYQSNRTLRQPNPAKTLSAYPQLDPDVVPCKSYFVERTENNNLPVYSITKSQGRTNKLTQIRRITGDIGALKRDIVHEMAIPEVNIKINQLTNHLFVKGWMRDALSKWLQEKNF